MSLLNPQVQRSHAQLTGAWFNREVNGPNGNVTVGGAGWYLCDFTNPWDTGCRMFWVQFRANDDGSKLVRWVSTSMAPATRTTTSSTSEPGRASSF